jgi:polar amino acid transport system substrate-binding protein
MSDMLKYVLYIAFLSFPFQALAQPLPAAVILANSSYPPYVMPDNQSGGPGIDMEIAMSALERMGVRTIVKLAPFKRVLAMLEEGQADLTTSLSYRPERDAYLYWSLPYRTDTNYIFFTRKDAGFQPERMEDLRGRKVGVVRGFVFPSTFADDQGIEKVEAPHIPSMVGMLLEGRFDAFIVNSIVGKHELKATNRMDEVRQAPFILRTPDDKGTVMGFSKARVSRDFVGRFNEEIRKMLGDGTIGRIEAKYLD